MKRKATIVALMLAAMGFAAVLWLGLRTGAVPILKKSLSMATNVIGGAGARTPFGPRPVRDVFKDAQEVLDRRPITFYGRVVDDSGKPMSAVKVLGMVTYPEGFVRTHREEHTTTTDTNGLFTFQGLRGADITIEPKKEGYNSRQKSFFYSLLFGENKRHTPDASQPIVFVIQKSLGSEPMYFNDIDYSHIPVDGTPVRFDLETGRTVVEGGDLEISVKWESEVKFQDRFRDWSVRLTVSEGGLIKRTRDMLFIAPASGYSPYVEYRFAADSRESLSGEEYILKSRNGKNHARIQFYLSINWFEQRASLTLRSWLNPSSSRNLEYDQAKRIVVP